MRDAKNPDELVSARLRTVLTPAAEAAQDRLPASRPGREPAGFTDDRPLRWSDIVPSWPDDADIDPLDDPHVADAGSVPDHGAGSLLLEELGGPPQSGDTSVLPLPQEPAVPGTGDEDDEPAYAPALTTAGAFAAPRRLPPGGSGSGRLAAFDPGRRGVKALAAVAAVVVLIAAVLAWRARPRVDPVPAIDAQPAATTGSQTDHPAGVAAGRGRPAASGGTELVVAVGGKVRRPGLVHLAAGSRVADALQAAGGPDRGVDVAPLNLARKVVDGELIMVGVTPAPGAGGNGAAGVPAAGARAPATGPVNLNTATLADLDTLPGVGPVLAQRILDARDAQGGFTAVSDLRKVDGIGDARYEQLKDLVVV